MALEGVHGNGTGIGKSSADRASEGPLQRRPARTNFAKSVLDLSNELSKNIGQSSKVRGLRFTSAAAPPVPPCDHGLCLCRRLCRLGETLLELLAFSSAPPRP